MRRATLAAAAAVIAVAVIGWPSAVGSAPRDRTVEALRVQRDRQRDRADDLQRRLTRRVLEARSLRRSLVHRPSSLEALRLAAVVYHVPFRLLYRIASCESTGTYTGPSERVSERTLSASAKNRSSTAAGLAQALDSTWAASIFAGFSPYSPYASALFMGREVAAGHLWQWTASRRCWA
jgi:hypothetical protein